eukprot:355656-Chlamydomonas_euryale.AAC.7
MFTVHSADELPAPYVALILSFTLPGLRVPPRRLPSLYPDKWHRHKDTAAPTESHTMKRTSCNQFRTESSWT